MFMWDVENIGQCAPPIRNLGLFILGLTDIVVRYLQWFVNEEEPVVDCKLGFVPVEIFHTGTCWQL